MEEPSLVEFIKTQRGGPCAKVTVTCTLSHPDGRKFVGTNWCANPQKTCPREPGEDYTKCKTVCDQYGHAEADALRVAGADAAECTARINGHTYYCMACQHALFAAGVVSLFSPNLPPPVARPRNGEERD
jgi:hypothetical protein